MTTRYEDRSLEELRQLAAGHDIQGRSTMSKEELVTALRGNEPTTAAGPGGGRKTGPKLNLTAVYDADQQQIVMVFNSGTVKEQKENAQDHIDRLHAHTGDAPERDLYVVELQEV